jgi:hypothetical protein
MAHPSGTGSLDPEREALLGALAHHRVVFVLIGGAAIQSHGRRYDTPDSEAPLQALCVYIGVHLLL